MECDQGHTFVAKMQEPIVKRVNTISLKFTTRIRNNKACEYILGQALGLKRNDVKSLGYAGLRSVYVKLSSYESYSSICENYQGRTYTVDGNTTVQIEDVSTYKLKVLMKNVPFELSNPSVKPILEPMEKLTVSLHAQLMLECLEN